MLALSMWTKKSATLLDITPIASATSHTSASPGSSEEGARTGLPRAPSRGPAAVEGSTRNAKACGDAGPCRCGAGCWRKTVVSEAGGTVGGFIVVVFVIYGW